MTFGEKSFQNRGMKGIKLTEDERRELVKLEKQIPHKGIGIRIRIILALDLGYTTQEVAEILLVDEDTVTKWKKKYLQSRYLSDWLGTEYQGYQGKLTKDQERRVETFVEDEVVKDCQQVADYIKNLFGVEYTIDGITKLLHRLGFVYKQTVVVPAKADKAKQEAFLSQYAQLKQNLKATEKILFMDGVHPTHNTRTVRCWIKKGFNKQIKTNSGRARLNIQGAFDLEEIQAVTYFSETINAQAVIEFFNKVQAVYSSTLIYLICDNATYYKNKDVKAYLNQPNCRLKLIFLPSYSPNLNFIERLWKYLHQKIIGVKYREKFKEFKYDITEFFEHLDDYKEDLRPFIGTKLRLIQS